MRLYSAHLDLSAALERAHACPGCGSTDLVAEADDDRTSFYCRGCERCWRFEAGDVTAVDPRTCAHCRRRSGGRSDADVPDLTTAG